MVATLHALDGNTNSCKKGYYFLESIIPEFRLNGTLELYLGKLLSQLFKTKFRVIQIRWQFVV